MNIYWKYGKTMEHDDKARIRWYGMRDERTRQKETKTYTSEKMSAEGL